MNLVDRTSLAATLDRVNEAFFGGCSLSKVQRQQAARWIASRQGLPGSYAEMFAPTERDFRDGVVLFTGERLVTRAGLSHVLGEEACRALILLKVPDRLVEQSLVRASAGMLQRIKQGERSRRLAGTYCCGTCSVSLWRHLAAGGLDRSESRLAAGMKVLKAHRDGQGRWRRFPFYYTLLALTEIDHPAAVREMRYAAASCQRCLKRPERDDPYGRRRRTLAELILARC